MKVEQRKTEIHHLALEHYQAVALDIDGTVLTDDHAITPSLLEAVRAVTQYIPTVSLISARPIRSVLKIARELGLKTPVAGLNGAIITDIDGNEVHRVRLPEALLRAALDICDRCPDSAWHIYSGMGWFVSDSTSPYVHLESEIIGFAPDGEMTVRDVGIAEKILLTGRNESLSFIEAELAQLPDAHVSFSKNGYLEITSIESSKAEGLKKLCEITSVPMDRLIAVGDGMNDLEMLQLAGLGVAMGNAEEKVKAVADLVIESNNNDGLAPFLLQFAHALKLNGA